VASHRPLYAIAREIQRHWANIYFGAKPYVEALGQLNSINDMYYADPAKDIVLRFLANAGSFRGPEARRIKTELKAMLQ
jgi:hypothetical protein